LHRSQPARACPPASTACHQESSAQVTSLQVNNAGTLGAVPAHFVLVPLIGAWSTRLNADSEA
ncbi:hypothetical protein, partial [Mycobacterium marinum]